MDLNPVVIAIPMYFTLMGIELVAEALSGKRTYRLNDAVTNISTGTLQQMTGTFLRILKIGIYVVIYEKLAFFHIEPTWWSFVAVFILWDLCYYWDHRFAHEVSLFWGGHSVHHQSEDYNLSVALRQSSTSIIWGTPFYLPLAFLGFDPTQFALVGGFNLLYQFWIHTEHIHRMPSWFEAVFNTPSHHRVHHGRDPKYLDKNYAGVFIVWDRMFGTFKQEEERPHYGVTKPLNSWNPVYANFAHYIDLAGYVRKARTAADALKILFYPPGWLPDYLGGFQTPPEVDDRTYHKYNPQPSALPLQVYILVQFFGALAVNSFYFFRSADFSSWPKVLFALWIIVTTLAFGFLLERQSRWVIAVETVRLASLPLGLSFLQTAGFGLPAWVTPASVIFSAISLLFFMAWNFSSARLETSR
ncbi:MAG: sterol desaturase family protein [Haliscomenobacter sp.]|nr:sterol desaturase family protein [Haliscomenobacter sp.]